ncbi:MAG TPA: CoA-binding protein [Bryobacteraceae bacterium]|nr:CoA-binding protein [Bryobacteraceae bacterium]
MTIPDLLRSSRTIAVVGLSHKKFRPSYGVAEYMQREGYRIIPVNPNENEVLGEKSYARLEDVPEHIDIVDIFRRSEFVAPIVESAIRVGAKAVWMQEDVADESAAQQARDAGLFVVMDRCILKEHSRHLR